MSGVIFYAENVVSEQSKKFSIHEMNISDHNYLRKNFFSVINRADADALVYMQEEGFADNSRKNIRSYIVTDKNGDIIAMYQIVFHFWLSSMFRDHPLLEIDNLVFNYDYLSKSKENLDDIRKDILRKIILPHAKIYCFNTDSYGLIIKESGNSDTNDLIKYFGFTKWGTFKELKIRRFLKLNKRLFFLKFEEESFHPARL